MRVKPVTDAVKWLLETITLHDKKIRELEETVKDLKCRVDRLDDPHYRAGHYE